MRGNGVRRGGEGGDDRYEQRRGARLLERYTERPRRDHPAGRDDRTSTHGRQVSNTLYQI